MNKIICGDCRDAMKRIASASIALVITSPPYRAGKEYEKRTTVNEYKSFAESWVAEIPRLVTSTGSFWLNLGYTKIGKNETLPLTYIYWQLVKMKLIQEVVWHYEGGMSYKKRFTHRTERWQWFSHDPDNVLFNLDDVRDLSLNRTIDKRNHPLGKNPTDYWYFNRVVSGTGKVKQKTIHPAQFPEAMIARIILACSNEGDTILDPLMGSGTVGVVAKRLKRNFIGIEKERKYIKAARKRINNA